MDAHFRGNDRDGYAENEHIQLILLISAIRTPGNVA